MKSTLIAISFLSLFLAVTATAQPVNKHAGFDDEGKFIVEVAVPAGSGHAVLEMSTALDGSQPWRKMIAGTVDGRAATLTFRLPPQAAGRLFARVRTGVETAPPAVELADPLLYTASYASGIPLATKANFMKAAGAKMREWLPLPETQYQANLIAWAAADPNVDRAELAVVAGNVSILFKDGTTGVLLNRPRTGEDAGRPQPNAAGVPAEAAPGFAGAKALDFPVFAGGIPGNNKAVAAFALESTFPNSAPKVANWLNFRGYQADANSNTQVSEVMAWSDAANPLGALFWHAHGCGYKKKDGSECIAIVTRNFIDPAASQPVLTQLYDGGEIILAQDDREALPYCALTSRFIRNRMKFAPRSLVVLDVCFGGHPELMQGFIDAGAGTVAGWDWLSGPKSGTPCLKIFDRLLGMNAEAPISTPKERPFSFAVTYAWLTGKGYDIDPSAKYQNQDRPNSKLLWKHHPQNPANILMPAIKRVYTESAHPGEPYSKFLLEGDFGPDPGVGKRSVIWGGQELQIIRWVGLNVIAVRVPRVPPAGNIEMILHPDYYSYSNSVPVTEWTVPFAYESKSLQSLKYEMNLNVRFRADIRGAREAPEGPVIDQPMDFSNMADCTGTVTASGVHNASPTTTITWSGGSSLKSVDPNESGNGALTHLIENHGTMNIAAGEARPFDITADGTFTTHLHAEFPDGSVIDNYDTGDAGLDATYLFFDNPPKFNGVTGVMAGGTRSHDANTKLTWPSVTPAHAPDNDTPR